MIKTTITKKDLSLTQEDIKMADVISNIKTDSEVEHAAEILIYLKEQVDLLEEKRKQYVSPSQEAINKINADFKELTIPRLTKIEQLKEKVLDYVGIQKQELKKKEKEVQKELKNNALMLTEGANMIVCKNGELRFRKTVDVKVTNQKKIPEKYWVLDMKAIEKDLANGIEIPGVKETVNEIGTVAIYKQK